MEGISPFPSYPLPERFRTYADAMAFIRKPDWNLCIPIYIQENNKAKINPAYENAPFEQQIIWLEEDPCHILRKNGSNES